jgi:hypothetical protein
MATIASSVSALCSSGSRLRSASIARYTSTTRSIHELMVHTGARPDVELCFAVTRSTLYNLLTPHPPPHTTDRGAQFASLEFP